MQDFSNISAVGEAIQYQSKVWMHFFIQVKEKVCPKFAMTTSNEGFHGRFFFGLVYWQH